MTKILSSREYRLWRLTKATIPLDYSNVSREVLIEHITRYEALIDALAEALVSADFQEEVAGLWKSSIYAALPECLFGELREKGWLTPLEAEHLPDTNLCGPEDPTVKWEKDDE